MEGWEAGGGEGGEECGVLSYLMSLSGVEVIKATKGI